MAVCDTQKREVLQNIQDFKVIQVFAGGVRAVPVMVPVLLGVGRPPWHRYRQRHRPGDLKVSLSGFAVGNLRLFKVSKFNA